MMLPILISVSVAPVSYFFCASADVEAAANKASVAAATARRVPVTGIAYLPHVFCRRCVSRPSRTEGSLAFLPAKLSFCGKALNKKPPRQSRGGCVFSSQAASARAPSLPSLARGGRGDVREHLPFLALETHHLQLLDRRVIGRRSVDLDAGEQRVRLEILQARGLLHDVVARQVVAAHLQHLHQRLRNAVAENGGAIEPIAVGIVFGEEFQEFLHAGIVVPLR